MIKLKNSSLRKPIVLGIAAGALVSVIMLLVSQSILLPLFDNDAKTDSNLENRGLSPLDWDFTSSLNFNEVLLDQQREDALVSYFFLDGHINNALDGKIQSIKTTEFYGEHELVQIQPAFDTYPQNLEIATYSGDFNLEMMTTFGTERTSVTTTDLQGINQALSEAMQTAVQIDQLDASELATYRNDYYVTGNEILYFTHVYSDGSVLEFEMINSENIMISFSSVSQLQIEASVVKYSVNDPEYYLFELDSFDKSSYVSAVIDLIDIMGI